MMKNNKFKLAQQSLVILTFIALLNSSDLYAEDSVSIDNKNNISITVQSTDISEVFQMLSREGNVNILLNNGVQGDVSVNLYSVSLDKAIRTIAGSAGFAVEYTDDTYFIVPKTEVGKDHANAITELKTFKVQYSDPEQISTILTKHLSRYGKITSLTTRNLLVVEDLPEFLQRIEILLAELDSQPKQILIEAKILEISLDESETYGIDWSNLVDIDSQSTAEFGIQGLALPGSPGFFFSLINPNINLALNALDAKGRVKTLSTPKLLALEHEEAEVIIGDRTGYQVTTTINQVTTESVAFLESGIILRVRSFVDQNGKIMMEIHPEVSTATINNNIPSLSTTEVTTNFLAEDGQTIFIAGLMRNSSSRRREGVPVLSDIPVVGLAFSNSEDVTLNTETVVMITPYIVEAGDNLYMTKTKKHIDTIEAELEEDVYRVEKKLDKKISPVEIMESKEELQLDYSITKPTKENTKAIQTQEVVQQECQNVRLDSIYCMMQQNSSTF